MVMKRSDDDLDALTYTIERLRVQLEDRPPSLNVILRIIRTIVESTEWSAELEVDETQRCGRLMLNLQVSRAFWDAIDVNLTLAEFNIVRLLASNAGSPVNYRAVYDCTHPVGFMGGRGDYGYLINVRASIKRIRNKFRLIDPEFGEIQNFVSFGYRWGRSKGSER